MDPVFRTTLCSDRTLDTRHRSIAGHSMLLVFLVGVLVANRAQAAQAGDLLAADGRLLFAIDPTTGVRTILSDFSNAAQGPTGSAFRVATGSGGVIYVTDGASDQLSKLFQVFSDGSRAVVSDSTNALQGLPFHTTDTPFVDTDGSILVSDRGIGGGGNDSGLWRVNATTGARTKLFSFGGHPQGIALSATNQILLGDAEGGTDCHTFGGCGALYNVNRVTFALTTLADFGNPAQGPLGEDAGYALAKDNDGTILVTDPFAPPCPAACGVLFRWDPVSGMHTYVTKFGDPTQGPAGFRPQGVAVASNGTIFLSSCAGAFSSLAVCTVDRTTGARTVFSDFGNPLQGPLGAQGGSLAILQTGGVINTATPTPAVTATPTPTNTAVGVLTATSTPAPIAAAAVPTLSQGMLLLLALGLAVLAVVLLRRP